MDKRGRLFLVRPDATGASIDDAPSGYYANPAAFAPPASGQWGTAGRNSIRGPSQFSLNAGVGRNFAMGSRLNLEWRLDATNVINRVTFASITPIVGNPQFGLPNVANPMRKIQMTARLRY